jgi:hypothetical protein
LPGQACDLVLTNPGVCEQPVERGDVPLCERAPDGSGSQLLAVYLTEGVLLGRWGIEIRHGRRCPPDCLSLWGVACGVHGPQGS